MKISIFFMVCFIYVNTFSKINIHTPKKLIEPVEFIAEYTMHYQEDSTDPGQQKEEVMLLLLGKSSSKFISAAYYIGDSILNSLKSSREFEKMAADRNNPLPIVRFRYRIFKNYPAGKITFIDNVLGSGSFKYEEPINPFDWELRKDTANINGYRAQKAICKFGGREWTAWFAPEDSL